MKKINLNKLTNMFWILNLIVFVVVVFMSVDQTAKSNQISQIEEKIYEYTLYKGDLTEDIIKNQNIDSNGENIQELGFATPEKTVYLDVDENLFASSFDF